MTTPVIQVHDLGKRYRIGTLRRHSTLGETIAAAVSAPFRRAHRNGSAPAFTPGEQQPAAPGAPEEVQPQAGISAPAEFRKGTDSSVPEASNHQGVLTPGSSGSAPASVRGEERPVGEESVAELAHNNPTPPCSSALASPGIAPAFVREEERPVGEASVAELAHNNPTPPCTSASASAGIAPAFMRGKGRFSAPETTQQQSRASAPAPHDDILWALRHVSFEVRQGEVVGLIGRNGAGKSTLLKLLARITRPTEGWAEVRGRVGSLLEVGTGFHPQLTGRENVFLSGAILGMRKAEIARKFDEIVAFAEVDRFLDTQLKHYSSGMQMRLAFAVAAHLEPEILFVDEVLAVGDAAFQKKCLGKMSDVARQGRTILFVSHNMAAINALCHRCLILEGGTVTFDGPTSHATSQYYSRAIGASRDSDLSIRERKGTGKAKFLSIAVHALDSAGRKMEIGYPGCDLSVKVSVQCLAAFPEANLAVILYDSAGYRLIDTNTAQQGRYVSLEPGQTAEAEFVLKQVLLRPGKYFIELWLGRHGLETIDEVEYAASIDFSETAESTKHSTIFPGTYLCRFEHRVSVLQPSP